MLEEIFNKYRFKQLSEFLEKIKSEIIEEETKVEYKQFSTQWIEIKTILKNGLNLKILINQNEAMNIITFYFKKDLISLEQIEFMLVKHNEYSFNRVIRHDYFIVNDDIATTFNSAYTFTDNNYISGWEKIRKINFKYISHYAGRDNLANFSCHIDGGKNEILYKEDNEVLEEKTIISVMASALGKQYVKTLKQLNK